MKRHSGARTIRRGNVVQLLGLVLLCVLLAACTPVADRPSPEDESFSGEASHLWVIKQCDYGYRIPGSQAIRQTGDMIIDELKALGWSTQEQAFTYMETPIRNILAWKGEGPALLLGAHYDTRPAADQEDPGVPVLGANDGASGVAVLLELARVLDIDATEQRVYLAFFDAEDSGRLNGWDWIVGSTYMAAHWGEAGEPPLTTMVLVDMIGDADQQVYYEQNSDPTLRETIWAVAGQLGYGERIIPEPKYAIIDDHIPFVRMGLPAVDMIDFDYPYWHTTQDTPDKVSAESLEAIGRTLEVWLESGTSTDR